MINMFLFNRATLVCTLFFISAPAFSADLYYGLRFGFSQFDANISNTTGTADTQENDFGFKLLAGYPLGNNLAIEAFYTDYGRATVGGNTGDSFNLNGQTINFASNDSEFSSDVATFGFSGVYNYPLSESRTLIGKLGIHRWKNDVRLLDPSNNNINTSDDGYDVYWNVGFEQKLGKELAFIFDYEAVGTDNVDLNSFGVTVVVKF